MLGCVYETKRGFVWCHEVAFELVCGADFWCSRHCKTSPVVLDCFGGKVWPKLSLTPTRTFPALLLSGTQFGCSSLVSHQARVSGLDRMSLVLCIASLSGLGCIACLIGNLKAAWPEICGPIFGRCSVTFGRQTHLDRRGLSCSAGFTKTQPGRQILRPIRGAKTPARLPLGTQSERS